MSKITVAQKGLSLIEIVVASLLATTIFLGLASITTKIEKGMEWQESIAYRQQILLDGWGGVVKGLKKVQSDYTIQIYRRLNVVPAVSISNYMVFKNNGVILSSDDVAGKPVIPSYLLTTQGAGPSKVNLPSDQLVIQYTRTLNPVTDCEGNMLDIYSVNQTSAIERYFVRSEPSGDLSLVCDAGRYNQLNGFTGFNDGGVVMVPKVDFFQAMLTTRLNGWFFISNWMSAPKTLANEVSGVDVGIIFHSKRPSDAAIDASATVGTFSLMDVDVTLNDGATTADAIYDVLSNTVSFGYMGVQ